MARSPRTTRKKSPRRVKVKVITRVFSEDDGRKVALKNVQIFDSTKKGRTRTEYTVAKSIEGERINNEIRRAKEIATKSFPELGE